MSLPRMKPTSFWFEYTDSASSPSSPACRFRLICLLTHMYPFNPKMRSTPQGSETKCDFNRLMRMGGTQTSWPFRSWVVVSFQQLGTIHGKLPCRTSTNECVATLYHHRRMLVLLRPEGLPLRKTGAFAAHHSLIFSAENGHTISSGSPPVHIRTRLPERHQVG